MNFLALFTPYNKHHYFLKFKKNKFIIVKGFNKLIARQEKKT